ncbi:MAG: type II secretion system GspH family protein [Phycisphaerae bacterium]|nr:type II secretion system GspH family protein [Phycisphaerae bacterium]
MCDFKNNLFRTGSDRRAFTLIEVATALMLLGIIIGAVMTLMNRYVEAVIDMQLREQAFEIARGNMETLLAESKLSDTSEYGTSETYPDIEWETVVEPFYEPVTNQMWIRAVCSAGFKDSKGEFQDIELEHWITNLTAAQVKQILAQQKVESEYMDLLNGGEDSVIQETTTAYLEERGLDADAYKRLIEQQRRKKLEYITEKGFDGYEEFVETLKAEENKFLEDLGMDFDGYNEFAATYVPQSTFTDDPISTDPDTDMGPGNDGEPGTANEPDNQNPTDYGIDWSQIPPELVPLIEQLLGVKKP